MVVPYDGQLMEVVSSQRWSRPQVWLEKKKLKLKVKTDKLGYTFYDLSREIRLSKNLKIGENIERSI